MSLLEELKFAGLTGNSAKVYLHLSKWGEINANLLAKKIGLDRSLTYTVLNNLIEKGLVSYIVKNTKRYYKITDPKNLLLQIKEKEQVVIDLIPKISEIQPMPLLKNSVEILEGKEGFKKALEEAFRSSGEWLFFGGKGASFDVLKWEMPHMIKRFSKGKKTLRGLINSKYLGHDLCKLKNVNVKGIKNLDEEATTTICGDVVVIHLLKEKPFVILIRSEAIANNYRSFFENMWNAIK